MWTPIYSKFESFWKFFQPFTSWEFKRLSETVKHSKNISYHHFILGSAVDTTSSDLFYPYHFHTFQCQKQNLSLSIVGNGNKEFFNLRDEKWLKFTMKTNKFIIHTKKKFSGRLLAIKGVWIKSQKSFFLPNRGSCVKWCAKLFYKTENPLSFDLHSKQFVLRLSFEFDSTGLEKTSRIPLSAIHDIIAYTLSHGIPLKYASDCFYTAFAAV